MASELVPRKGPHEEEAGERGGRVVRFPDSRSFGPLRWRTIRVASLAVVILLIAGALLEIFLLRAWRDTRPVPADAARVPGS